MERLSQAPISEPIPPGAAGGSVARSATYLLLAGMLLAGGWIRFNQQIASVAPQIAAPARALAERAATPAAGVQSLMELTLVPRSAEPGAVASLGLPAGQAAQLADALKRDRVRLVQLPLFDAGASSADGGDAGRSVTVSTAGFSRLVPLGRQPVVVTLPINRAGTLSFTTAASASDPVGIGALTANGPVRLPDLARGEQLDVGVIAQ